MRLLHYVGLVLSMKSVPKTNQSMVLPELSRPEAETN